MLASWLFWGAIALIGIALLSKVPGVDIALKPISILLQDLVRWCGATSGGYLVYLIKTFIGAHLTLLEHLMHPESHFDVEVAAREQTER